MGTDEGRKPDTPGWEVRVVPNKYPAFERQEVVVHSPEHKRSLAELDREQLDLVAKLSLELYAQHHIGEAHDED